LLNETAARDSLRHSFSIIARRRSVSRDGKFVPGF
jgi:hypothetical protein